MDRQQIKTHLFSKDRQKALTFGLTCFTSKFNKKIYIYMNIWKPLVILEVMRCAENDTLTPRKAQCWRVICVLCVVNYFLREGCYFSNSWQFDGCTLFVSPSKHSKPPSQREHVRTHTHICTNISICLKRAITWVCEWLVAVSSRQLGDISPSRSGLTWQRCRRGV